VQPLVEDNTLKSRRQAMLVADEFFYFRAFKNHFRFYPPAAYFLQD